MKIDDTNDFGFSFESEAELTKVSVTTEDQIKKLEDEIAALKSNLKGQLTATQDYAKKLDMLVGMILPLMNNLKKEPEKEFIKWPNRVAPIDKFIVKVNAIWTANR